MPDTQAATNVSLLAQWLTAHIWALLLATIIHCQTLLPAAKRRSCNETGEAVCYRLACRIPPDEVDLRNYSVVML
jgi:hypothetical protein